METSPLARFAPLIEELPLFAGIPREALPDILPHLAARVRAWHAGAFPVMEGDVVREICVVLDGSAQVLREDYLGRRSIITPLAPGDLFAETFALAGVPAPVGVQALTGCEILMLDYTKALDGGQAWDARLVANLLMITARKNLHLNERLSHLEKRTIRERLLSFLSAEARRRGSHSFTIPFDRQQLADYLSVDRSALSAELSRMEKEGLLQTRRSHFILPESRD